jgi:hypothetical protein
MAEFSASDAATTGFRVVREHPTAVLFWAVAQLLVGAISTVLLVGMAGPAMNQLQSMSAGSQDPAASIKALQQLAPVYVLMLPISLVIYGVIYAAMNRIVLRPEDSRFGYLRLGADELRQVGVLVLIFLIMVAVYIVSLILAVVFGAIIGGVAAVAGGPNATAAVSALAVIIAMLGVLAAIMFVGTKLSLASPMTFATGKIDLFGSWALTKGRFWPIFGTYFLAFILMLLTGLLAMLIIGAIMAAIAGAQGAMAMFMKPDMSSVTTYFSPARIVYLVLVSAFTALFLPIWLTPPAAIYRSLTAGRDRRTVEAVFS